MTLQKAVIRPIYRETIVLFWDESLTSLLPPLLKLDSCVRHFSLEAKTNSRAECLESNVIKNNLFLFPFFYWISVFLLFLFTSEDAVRSLELCS